MKKDWNGFKSQEELWFSYWLDELKTITGIEYEYEPQVFELCPAVFRTESKTLKSGKIKTIQKCKYRQHIYKPDFRIIDDNRQFTSLFLYTFNAVWIDTKGGWMNRGSGQEFAMNQKWMWQIHQIDVNKVVPEKLFFQTFLPEQADIRLTPITRKPTKFYNCRTADQWLAENGNVNFAYKKAA